MLEYPNLLLVGGSKRNVGKTTLILHFIEKYKNKYPITGLKVTSIYPDDDLFHGKHDTLSPDFEILEEKDRSGRKDTSKMLLAGARHVFFIRTKDAFIEQAFDSFQKQMPGNGLILCESISLRKYVQPGLFILIHDEEARQLKKSFNELKPLADVILRTNGNCFNTDIDRIEYSPPSWRIK
ncbi:MAG: hypothetical protein ISR55_07045 [Bacteroidetes bacterium]|nr:hypothetical protein [Bacteroidota bacterium]MBL6963560.1 hypothetical protein [Bacteroidota bacterium]